MVDTEAAMVDTQHLLHNHNWSRLFCNEAKVDKVDMDMDMDMVDQPQLLKS